MYKTKRSSIPSHRVARMATAMVSAASFVVGKALSPFTDSLLEKWAASVELGSNVRALQLELLSVKALLEPALGKEIDNSALKELLLMLQELGYDADDVLDELDYFRIQDDLDGTFDASEEHAKGCASNLSLHAKAVGKQICLPACLSANREDNGCKAKLVFRACNPIHAVRKCFDCSSLPSVRDDDETYYNSMLKRPQRSHTNEPPKLRFNRVDASKRMKHITEQLQLVQQKVSGIITTLGPNWSTVPNISQSRPITTSESIGPKLYGRDLLMISIIHDITKGKHSIEDLTVIPVVGPGGIGKTTLAQHIYHSGRVQEHFDVKVWTCVSLNFNVNRLIEEIGKHIPIVDGESVGTAGELIGQRIKNKRFLLVMDDMWDCRNEDEWKRLLLPFKKSQVQGNVIMVTTRFPAQAEIMIQKNDNSICLQGLERKEFKELFLDFVFGDDPARNKNHTFLLETGDKIASKLKGSPLAAKTVGRLLRKQLDLVHWTRVLESNEWAQSNSENDIMPALKLSYDYLPFQLQRCFYYCALFPRDYKFEREELVNFWIGQDVLHSSSRGKNGRVEEIGLTYLEQLVNHGFFKKERETDGSICYIIHDLLHELARIVSSHECLCIESSQVRSLQISSSTRHLSINIDDTSVEDRLSLRNCVDDFNKLVKGLKVENLRTFMLFGKHHGCFVKAFGDLFRTARTLRVIFLCGACYDVEDLFQNFYNLVHLRYLRIQNSFLDETRFPYKLSRFYHMMVLHFQDGDINYLPRDMSNLVKLRHFLVPHDSVHSRIVEVGKLKSLQELRRFTVQQCQDFELRQIGYLVELCGLLFIDNLQNVRVKEEADEAKLMQKSCLQELVLCWNNCRSTNDSALEEHVLERLKPSTNLLKLSIIGHRGTTCPSWLGLNLSVKSLKSLSLNGVDWKSFPPIGEFWLDNVPHEEISGNIPGKKFGNLTRLELVNLPLLKKWTVHAPCQLLPCLEVLVMRNCPKLVELSFQHIACCQQEKVACANWFPSLSGLVIESCPRLLSFPPIPWTEAPCSIRIQGTGSSCTFYLKEDYYSKYCLECAIQSNGTPDSTFWNALAFHNLTKLQDLSVIGFHPPPLRQLQMLSSLRNLKLSCSSYAQFVECDNHVKYQFPVKWLDIDNWNATGKELTQLLAYFPKLSSLYLRKCEKITELDVTRQWAMATSVQSSTASNTDEAKIEQHDGTAEGLFLLLPQLQGLTISNCPELSLRFNLLDDNNDDGQTGEGGGLQGLSSLRSLSIIDCPKLLSSYSPSSFSSNFPFPNSLEYLFFSGVVGATETLPPLSNLSSLRSLSIYRCGDLRGEGLLPLLAPGHLASLIAKNTANFFVDLEPPRMHEQQFPSRSSKLQYLFTDDVAGVTAVPIPSSIFSSLTTLELFEIYYVERFTEEQEAILFVSSLEHIKFMSCRCLQYLPARLHTLSNLKTLCISKCKAIQMLPEDFLPSSLQELKVLRCPQMLSLPDSLPSSLQQLFISDCPKIRSLAKDGLPSSLQKLLIRFCPDIRSLPKVDDLPSSLREINVLDSGSHELRRQCCKLVGTIPIIIARPTQVYYHPVELDTYDNLTSQEHDLSTWLPPGTSNW